jgi:hypothetical protein
MSNSVFFKDFLKWADMLAPEHKQASFYDDGRGFVLWNEKGTEIITQAPSRLLTLGFLVEEFDGGWSAILPKSELLDANWPTVSRGACYIATCSHYEDGTEKYIHLEVSEFSSKTDHYPLNEHGWTFHSESDAPVNSLVYEFNRPSERE